MSNLLVKELVNEIIEQMSEESMAKHMISNMIENMTKDKDYNQSINLSNKMIKHIVSIKKGFELKNIKNIKDTVIETYGQPLSNDDLVIGNTYIYIWYESKLIHIGELLEITVSDSLIVSKTNLDDKNFKTFGFTSAVCKCNGCNTIPNATLHCPNDKFDIFKLP